MPRLLGLSDAILDALEDEEALGGEGSMALAFTASRIMAPPNHPPAEHVAFVKAFMEWAGTYWTEGGLN